MQNHRETAKHGESILLGVVWILRYHASVSDRIDMYLPLFHRMDDLPCLVVGGGSVAAHKMDLLLAAGCALTVVSPEIHERIRRAEQDRKLRWLPRKYRERDCAGFRLVVAATPDEMVNRAVYAEAVGFGIPVNVVDVPELCTVIFGASWTEGPLTVSVSTGGAAPFMASAVRDRISDAAAGLGPWVTAAAAFRHAVRQATADPAEREDLYRRFLARMSESVSAPPMQSGILKDWLPWLISAAPPGTQTG
jgi:uroporphyrin-III C-methyltransferase/precorrin-2 dehydrogenase/sirohydrochlorin ferrochelatase